jgi:hypothetical protein
MRSMMGNMDKAKVEVDTAITHAGLAARMKDGDKIHLHLHHAVHCLVGPDGKQFDAGAGNPCKGKGDGAINDVGTDAGMQFQLKRVPDEAESGIAATDAKQAHHAAATVESVLKGIEFPARSGKEK